MSNFVSKIENVLLTGPLDVVCSANVIYLAMNSNNWINMKMLEL